MSITRADDPGVVIVGASVGGLRTAESLRRGGYAKRITVIGEESHPPYQRPPLSKAALSGADDDVALPIDESLSIEWMLGTRVATADLDQQRVVSADGEDIPYAHLVVATGVSPRRMPSGRDIDGVFALRTLGDSRALRQRLLAGVGVVVAGAGVLGCEVAATATRMGCDVTVVGSSSEPMERMLGADLGGRLREIHATHGTRFEMGARAVGVATSDRGVSLVLEDGRAITADIVVETAGSTFNTQWLADADLELDGGIRTDSGMRALRRSGNPWSNVYAVGDVARFPHLLADGAGVNVQHWNIPPETARRAAQVIVATDAGHAQLATVLASPFRPLPTFWTDQHEARLMSYGLAGGATSWKLLEAGDGMDSIYGYYRGGELCGVIGLGMRGKLASYRADIAARLRA